MSLAATVVNDVAGETGATDVFRETLLMANFLKLGSNRTQQNISRIQAAPTALVIGDITRGEPVDVSFDNSDEESVSVKERRTGAILISCDLDSPGYFNWSISGTKLIVQQQSARTGTMTFWVF